MPGLGRRVCGGDTPTSSIIALSREEIADRDREIGEYVPALGGGGRRFGSLRSGGDDDMPLSRPPRGLFQTGGEGLVQGFRDPLGALDGDAVILVPLVAGDERLADAQSLGQLAP